MTRVANLEQHGRLYGELGFAIAWTVGLEGDDAKACRSKGWETTRPEPAEFTAAVFGARGLRANPCLVLQTSGLVGIDVDGPVGAARMAELLPRGLPETVTALSGRDGGAHLYFRPPPGCTHHKLEFKSDGSIRVSKNGYLVVPPALHPSGREYRFADGAAFGEVEIAGLPMEMLEAIVEAGGGDRRERVQTLAEGQRVAAGARHDALCAHAGLLRRGGLGEEAILEGLWSFFNHHCDTSSPADPDHLARIVRDAVKWAPGELPAGVWWRRPSANGHGPEEGDAGTYVDWAEFWARDHADADWDYEDVLARGRGHSIFAKHGTGKSLFSLFLASEMIKDGRVVIYVDYEQTEDDLWDRLSDMGHGPESDLSRLRYMLLPDIPPLSSPQGAERLLAAVDETQGLWPERQVVVVIDTIGRAVVGEENSNDPIRDFYIHTGLELKRRGVTWARLDHEGHQGGDHARGGSAKGDDVDVIWQLSKTDAGIKLHNRKRRANWIPEDVSFEMLLEPLRFEKAAGDWPAGTQEMAQLLADLGVPIDAPMRKAKKAVSEAGKGKRGSVIEAAQRWRRSGQQRKDGAPWWSRETLGRRSSSDPTGDNDGDAGGQPQNPPQNRTGDNRETLGDATRVDVGDIVSPYTGDMSPQTALDEFAAWPELALDDDE